MSHHRRQTIYLIVVEKQKPDTMKQITTPTSTHRPHYCSAEAESRNHTTNNDANVDTIVDHVAMETHKEDTKKKHETNVDTTINHFAEITQEEHKKSEKTTL